MNEQESKAEIFDVFLCHNSEDKPAVREIAQKLSQENIKPWLDEADIKAGSFWDVAIGQQIETVKGAAVFVGQHGVGAWQRREIIALLDQFDRRGCRVIPVILASAPVETVLPWSLVSLHCVDFRVTDSHPLKRLIWGITNQKPSELSNVPDSEKPATTHEVDKGQLLPNRDERVVTQKVRSSDLRLYPPLTKSPDEEQAVQLEILRRRVKEGWVDGVLKHSLHNEVQISLGKRQVDEFVDAPWKYRVEVSDAVSSGPSADQEVHTIYDAAGLLLILGEPGCGKTTTLLDLARTLLDRARDDIKERVPIVVNLSTWKNRQPLAEWISGELSEKYRVPRKIARFWLQQNYLLPLLDGLDEVETSTQPDCVAAINAFVEEFNPSGLVVCCRLNEYRWLPERLKLNGAICLEPLSSEEVTNYFLRGGSKLAALREEVDTDPVLQELTQTPLMLSIMSLACQGADVSELARQKGDSEERRKQIFRLYVEQMFHRKGMASLVFPKEKIIGWLPWLAGKMREHSESVFTVEGLQPSWLGARAKRAAYGTVSALSLGLIFGLADWLANGLTLGPIVGRIYGVISGLIIFAGVGLGCWSESPWKNGIMSGSIGGLIFWLLSGPIDGFISGLVFTPFFCLGVGSLNHITLVETVSWKWNQFWKRAIPGLLGGLLFGLFLGQRSGLISGFVYGLIFGLVTGLVGGFTDRVKTGKAFPNQGIKLSLKNSSVAFFVAWLAVGLIRELPSFGQALGPALGHGLIAGLIVGLNRGASAAIKHYALRLILWLNGDTPLNFIKFLDDCSKLILLKKVGGGYIFIHRMLLEYFADIPTQDISVKR